MGGHDDSRPPVTLCAQANAIPTSAPGGRAPTSEKPAPIKMTNQQHYKLDQATSVRTMRIWPPRTLPSRAACTENRAPSPTWLSRAPRPRQTKAASSLTTLQT
eukprot:scaffold36451_cov67-Phaeocystis_antarctica.AAC.3